MSWLCTVTLYITRRTFFWGCLMYWSQLTTQPVNIPPVIQDFLLDLQLSRTLCPLKQRWYFLHKIFREAKLFIPIMLQVNSILIISIYLLLSLIFSAFYLRMDLKITQNNRTILFNFYIIIELYYCGIFFSMDLVWLYKYIPSVSCFPLCDIWTQFCVRNFTDSSIEIWS